MGDDVGASFKSRKKQKKKKKTTQAESSVPSSAHDRASAECSQSVKRKKKPRGSTGRDRGAGGGGGGGGGAEEGVADRQRQDPNANPSERVKAAFEKFMLDTLTDGPEKLLREYDDEVRPYFPPDLRRTAFDANPDKNRYKDVVCGEQTRVVLADGHRGDYIHANYVRGEPLHNTFICTQGPMERTLVDFVRMIVQEKVRTILMLCELSEGGKKKCERYWPERNGEKMVFGDVTVTKLDGISNDGNVTMTLLEVQPADRHRVMVRHYQWKTWPDKSVPRTMQAVTRVIMPFLRVARLSRSATIVHCSAGIGRTGTVVGIEMCIQRLFSDRDFNRVQVIRHLKDQRCHSVQMDVQYLFIMAAVCEYAKETGLVDRPDTLEKYSRFMDEYENVMKRKTGEASQPTV